MDDIKQVVTDINPETEKITSETTEEVVQNTPEELPKILLKNKDNKAKWCYPLIIMVWCQTILVQYAAALIGTVVGMDIANIVITIIFIATACISLANVPKNIRAVDILTVVIMVVAYVLSYWLYMDENIYLDDITLPFILETIPLFLVGLLFDFGKTKKILYWLSVATIYAFILYYIVLEGGKSMGEYEWQEDMNSAYNLLPHVLLVMLFMFEKPNIINVITSAVGGVLIVSLGTRGPVLFVLAFLAIEFIFIRSKSAVKFKVVFLGVVAAVLLNLKNILIWMQDLFSSLGLSIRFVSKLLNDDITNATSRDVIYDTILGKIGEKPITGYGFAGDRQFLDGLYAHNIVLELWISLGVIFGTLAFAVICYIVIKGFTNCNNATERGFILVLVMCGLAKLFISGSFLTEKYLFLLIGFCIRTIRQHNLDARKELLNVKKSKYINIK